MKASDESIALVVADVYRRTTFPRMDMNDLVAAATSVLVALRRGNTGPDAVPGLLGELLEESFRALARRGVIERFPKKVK